MALLVFNGDFFLKHRETGVHHLTSAHFAVLFDQYKRDGARGLFRGAIPRVINQTPMAALNFCIFEGARRFLRGKDEITEAWH